MGALFCEKYKTIGMASLGFTDQAELEHTRTKLGDFTTVQGTRSHYYFNFDAPGVLQMRWLGCPCDQCWKRDYTRCVNVQMVGQRVPREVRQTSAHR